MATTAKYAISGLMKVSYFITATPVNNVNVISLLSMKEINSKQHCRSSGFISER